MKVKILKKVFSNADSEPLTDAIAVYEVRTLIVSAPRGMSAGQALDRAGIEYDDLTCAPDGWES